MYCTSLFDTVYPLVWQDSGDYSRHWVCAQVCWELGLSRGVRASVFSSQQLWPRIRHVFIHSYTPLTQIRTGTPEGSVKHDYSRFISFSVHCMNKCVREPDVLSLSSICLPCKDSGLAEMNGGGKQEKKRVKKKSKKQKERKTERLYINVKGLFWFCMPDWLP